MPKQCWLVKQEPDTYAWSAFVADGKTAWTGVRNFQARNNLRAMKEGDWVFYYHSNVGKEIVGLAKVAREAYPDPTAKEGDWSCVDLVPVKPLKKPVTLDQIKADPATKAMMLVTHSRLSVQPVKEPEFKQILTWAETKA